MALYDFISTFSPNTEKYALFHLSENFWYRRRCIETMDSFLELQAKILNGEIEDQEIMRACEHFRETGRNSYQSEYIIYGMYLLIHHLLKVRKNPIWVGAYTHIINTMSHLQANWFLREIREDIQKRIDEAHVVQAYDNGYETDHVLDLLLEMYDADKQTYEEKSSIHLI